MTKSYYNNAITGNSSILGCISENGELIRLYWPNIDYPQHIEKFNTGIYLKGQRNTNWLDSGEWTRSQHYLGDTNILNTVFLNENIGLKVTQSDFAIPGKDVFARSYRLENIGADEIHPGFAVYSSAVSNNQQLTGTIYDPVLNSLIHYRNNYYVAVSASMQTSQFQLGGNAFSCASGAELYGFDTTGMMQDGALLWDAVDLKPGESKQFTIYICMAHSLRSVKNLNRDIVSSDPLQLISLTADYWERYLKGTKPVKTGRADIDALYKRSLLVFKLMSDSGTGGLLASPEIDEDFTRCGRYAYCWGRDAAFITSALDICGLWSEVDFFYRWAANVQNEDGSWQQRYHMDGNLAPSWGLQIDETGTIIWGILQHYKQTGNDRFLDSMWPSVKKGAGFLSGFIDRETGLPGLSFDLWEERLGEHTYSSAAVFGGLRAAAEIARLLGREPDNAVCWDETAGLIREAIVKNFWKSDYNRFIRSVRTKMNPWGQENSDYRTMLRTNEKGVAKDFTNEDWTVDISLLGLSIPFEVFKADDPMMEGTAALIEQTLRSPASGGFKRYEFDNYIGGNPWIISTLWLALYYLERNETDKALECFDWSVRSRTGLDLLPEQADRETGKPAWVIPLTWSHAMFILGLGKFLKLGYKFSS